MDDRLLVRVLHSFADLHKQREAFVNGEAMPVAVTGDREDGHTLHDKGGATFRRGPGVKDLGNVGMLHQGQRLTLRLESRQRIAVVRARLDQLERDGATEGRNLLGSPNLYHAASANHLYEPIRTDARERSMAFVPAQSLVIRGVGHECAGFGTPA